MDKRSTEWFVITGAPSSGKTTLLRELAKKGFKVTEEAARLYIEQQLKKGKTSNQIRANELDFQKKVLKLKIAIESKLNPQEVIFLDRGMPDSVSYYKLCGVKHDLELEEAVNSSLYKKVFLLKLYSFKKDRVRTEDMEKARKIEALLENDYRKLGYKVVKVPWINIDQRVKFVLQNLSID